MRRLLIILCTFFILAGCSGDKSSTLSYEEIKKIMADSLQTEEGKKAVRQLLTDPEFKELLILEHDDVETALKTTLLSSEAEDFWKKTFEDPKFKETLAKSMREQQEELMKGLMKDAGYQEQLTQFFDQPEMQKQFESLLKSASIRKQTEEVVTEVIESPLMQAKWQELIRKSAEAGQAKEDEQKKASESKDK